MSNILEELFYAVYRFHGRAPKFYNEGMLTDVEFYLIALIETTIKQNNYVTVRELLDTTGTSKSALSKKLAVLEKKGLINRIPSEKDRRQVSVLLTEQGRCLYETEKQQKQRAVEQVIEMVGREDMEQFVKLLNKVLDAKEKLEERD